MSYKPGSVVGDYVVIGTVGTGGMGTVYKVQHVITKRIEAMKLLASGRTDADQEQRFVREMQVQARLHHPNIAAVYNAFKFYDEFFLVMEFIEGESLESVIERGHLSPATGIHYARQALFALGYAHAHGVVHRDIAPSNIIITPDGTVKLTDFGLAKTTTDIRLTRSGTPVGSPWYMSPEQVRGDAALDARSDVYSLGVILYEIATGSKPFDLASTFDVMRAHVEIAPLAPIDRVPELPRVLNDIILTAMAKDPNARFQSAEQFYTALEPLQAGGAPGAKAARVRKASAMAAAAPRGRSKPKSAGWLPAFAPVRVVQAALGTAACGLALFGGYAAYSYVHVSSAAEVPAIAPARPHIPAPPETPLPSEAVTPPAPAVAQAPAPVQPSLPLPPPAAAPAASAAQPSALQAAETRRQPVRRIAQHVPVPVNGERVREFAVAPAAPAAPPTRLSALPAAPVIPRSSESPGDATAMIPEDRPEPPSPPSAEAAAQEKKGGNRLFRALHKVVPFRKPGSSEPAQPADTPAADPR